MFRASIVRTLEAIIYGIEIFSENGRLIYSVEQLTHLRKIVFQDFKDVPIVLRSIAIKVIRHIVLFEFCREIHKKHLEPFFGRNKVVTTQPRPPPRTSPRAMVLMV